MRRVLPNLFPSKYEPVFEQIIAEIEAGPIPYDQPWRGSEIWPWNWATKKRYEGINMLILWTAQLNLGFERCCWLTHRQALARKLMVRPGERGTIIFFATRTRPRFSGRSRGIGRLYTVFNLDQCEGSNTLRQPPPFLHDARRRFEKLVSASGAEIRVDGTRAFYEPNGDFIQIPSADKFYFPENDIPRTILHELSHWCGHPARLNRKKIGDTALEWFAWEEVVAELAAACVLASLSISPSVHASAYIAEWLKATKAQFSSVLSPREAISVVADEAGRTADFILSFG